MAVGAEVPQARQQFCDRNGTPLASGRVYMYVPGTTTFANTWVDPSLTVLNPNPILLDPDGRAAIWAAPGASFRQVIYDGFGDLVYDGVASVPIPNATLSDANNIFTGSNQFNGPTSIDGAITFNALATFNLEADFNAAANFAGMATFAEGPAITTFTTTAGYLRVTTAGQLVDLVPAYTSVTTADPTGTASSSGVMAGLQAGVSTITPTMQGSRLLVIFNGAGGNSNPSFGFNAIIRYGVGTGPSNGAAPTGSVLGNFTFGSNLTYGNPFCLVGVVPNSVAGTPYWFDLEQYANGGGQGNLFSVVITVVEI